MSDNAADTLYAVRPADLAHDTIDGETVVIDLARGVYYRFEGAAALLWERLAEGAISRDLEALLHSRFEADPAVATEAVDRFLEELGAEGLVERRPCAAAMVVPPAMAAIRPVFAGLAVHRFSDLQELFWIDPVHDVDETGWPQRPATA